MGRPRTPLVDLDTYPHKYVRPQMLADFVDIPIRTIYYHIQKGALSAKTIGGVLRIPIESVWAYVGYSRTQTQQPVSTRSNQ